MHFRPRGVIIGTDCKDSVGCRHRFWESIGIVAFAGRRRATFPQLGSRQQGRTGAGRGTCWSTPFLGFWLDRWGRDCHLWHLSAIESCSKRNGVAAPVLRGDSEQPRPEDGWGKIGIPARPKSGQTGTNHGARCRLDFCLNWAVCFGYDDGLRFDGWQRSD